MPLVHLRTNAEFRYVRDGDFYLLGDSNTCADLGSHGDARGDWARFFVTFDGSTLTGTRGGAPPVNAYTSPGDATHNAPFTGYSRLEPYYPALGR